MNNDLSDERRKDFRTDVSACLAIDVPVAFAHKSVNPTAEVADKWSWDDLAITPDLMRAMADEKELTIRDPLLVQILTRIDWLLTSILKSLGKSNSLGQAVPEFMTVNLSSSGVRFVTNQAFPVGSSLVLRFVLRPFIPIQAEGKVIRVCPTKGSGEERFETAVEFTEIADDDREAIIRHVIRTQASVQRSRNTHSDPLVE